MGDIYFQLIKKDITINNNNVHLIIITSSHVIIITTSQPMEVAQTTPHILFTIFEFFELRTLLQKYSIVCKAWHYAVMYLTRIKPSSSQSVCINLNFYLFSFYLMFFWCFFFFLILGSEKFVREVF